MIAITTRSSTRVKPRAVAARTREGTVVVFMIKDLLGGKRFT
jgi:hypothetical protein